MARSQQPSVVLVDEIDELSYSEENSAYLRRIKTEFLVQAQDSYKDKVLILGTTNAPWKLDSAMRRRFWKRIYVPLPNKNERKELLKSMLLNQPNNAITEEDLIELSERTEGLFILDAFGYLNLSLGFQNGI